MIGAPENNNTELRSDSTSGDVSEVESGLEVTESEMDEELSKELDGSFDSFISDKKITSYDKCLCRRILSSNSRQKMSFISR